MRFLAEGKLIMSEEDIFLSEAFVYMLIKDPVCGMPLDPSKAQFTANFLSRQYYFDSEYCMNNFIEASKIAYFSMEIGINSAMPTYSGGLGVLAGQVQI